MSAAAARARAADEPLVMLAQPGPWGAVAAIIGYRGRVWFAALDPEAWQRWWEARW